jgi:hypothetical protein
MRRYPSTTVESPGAIPPPSFLESSNNPKLSVGQHAWLEVGLQLMTIPHPGFPATTGSRSPEDLD